MPNRAGSTTDSRRLVREVARSVDAPRALVPVFPTLFDGVPDLGSSPRRTLGLLERAGLRRRSRVIELACGKGSLAILLARQLKCDVVAVDGCEAFIDDARHRAKRAGVESRVRLVVGDVREHAARLARARPRYDAALMIGLLSLEEAGPMLRAMVRPGGLYVVDDLFRDERLTLRKPAFHGVPTREACERLIAAWGDRVVSADVPPPSYLRRLNDRLYERLARNAHDLAVSHPALRPDLRTFLANQRHAHGLLGRELRPATWVIQRG